MGLLYGLFKRIFKLIIYFVIFVTVITIIPNLPPYTKFTSIEISPVLERSGALAPNEALNNIQKLYEGKILGPEAFQIWKNEVYTSLATGEIVKLSPGGHVTYVTKIGQPCTGLIQEHICGRPLGFEIDEKNGVMYVADAYYGIWKVDLKTDKKQQLVSPNVPIADKKPQFFNSLTIDKNGGVYWTDSSSDYLMKDGAYVGLSDPSGRLFYYDPVKNENKVLIDDLWFPNGVVLSPDESFVVVSESLKQRLLKYYINGPKKGKSEVFIDGLPGTPDNLRALPDGSGIQIALYSAIDENNPMLTRTLANLPVLRKFLARVSRLIEIPVDYLNSQFPNPIFEDIVYKIGHISSVSGLAPNLSGLAIADWNGNIIASYYNSGNINHISDAVVYNDKLLMGAPHMQNFVAAVPAPPLLQKAYAKNVKQSSDQKPIDKQEKKEIPAIKNKPTEKLVTPNETPKPVVSTTTTPKPQTKPIQPKEKVTPPPEVEIKPKKIEKVNSPPKKDTPPTKQAESKSKKEADVKPQEKVKDSPPNVVNKEAKPKTESSTVRPKSTKSPENKATTTQKPESKPVQNDKVKIDKKNDKPTSQPEKAVKTENDDLGKKKTGNTVPVKDNPKHIPIVEEIVSDTAKPSKEKLKVITKSGPGEIPSPHV